jgi:hypothetical protein
MARIVIPQTLTLNSSNVAASGLSEYASGTSYTAGQQIKVSFESDGTTPRWPVREYEAAGSVTGIYPPDAAITEWVEIGAQNRDKMFDGFNTSRTVADTGENIEVTVTPSGRVRYLALLGLRNATSVTVEEEVSGVVKSTQTIALETSYSPVGWWAWLFGAVGTDRVQKRSAVFILPGYYSSPQINITIVSAGGQQAECGQCLLGAGFELGPTEFEAEPELKDYSTFEQNQFGTTRFISRQTVRNTRGTIWIPTVEYDRIYSIFESNMNRLAFFDLNNEEDGQPYSFDALRVYGKLESMNGGISYGVTPINLKIVGIE